MAVAVEMPVGDLIEVQVFSDADAPHLIAGENRGKMEVGKRNGYLDLLGDLIERSSLWP